jgi:pimeloyl-ACP methyl ester carboxylesterase
MSEIKIAFREVGEGPTLILLHGYAGSVLHWDPVIQELKSKYRVITPNLSHLFMGAKPMTFSQQISHFANFVQAHFPNQKINLAGISYGGALVWGFSLLHPKWVEKTIFINPMPPAPMDSFQIQILKSFFKLPLNQKSIYLILSSPLGQHLIKRAAQVFRSERADHWDRFGDLKGRRLLFVCQVIHNFSFILKNENWNLWKTRLESWTHPSLLIFDEKDPLFEPQTYQNFQELIGCEEVQEIQEAGHIATQVKGPEIAQLMGQFLDVKRSSTAAGF